MSLHVQNPRLDGDGDDRSGDRVDELKDLPHVGVSPPDHLVGHALVKHVYCTLKARNAAYLKRLAFFTLSEGSPATRPAHLRGSPPEVIDCIVRFDAADRAKGEAALACYRTYQTVVQEHDPMTTVAEGVCFELFGEQHDPPLGDLCEGLEAEG